MYRHDYLLHGNVHLSMANIAHGKRGCGWLYCESLKLNPLNADAAYIRVFIFYYHIRYHL